MTLKELISVIMVEQGENIIIQVKDSHFDNISFILQPEIDDANIEIDKNGDFCITSSTLAILPDYYNQFDTFEVTHHAPNWFISLYKKGSHY